MTRRFTIGFAGLLLAATGAAQVRGVPASVSSVGPQGYGRPIYNPNFIPVGPARRDRLGRAQLAAPIPLYYYGDIYPLVYLPPEPAPVPRRAPQSPEPQKIIVEIRDTRPAAPAVVPKEVESKPAPRAEVELPRVATVFIFQDGSRKELKDFAITPTELIDLSDGLIRRSPLGALDRAATLKANAEQGVELHFPASSSD